MSYLSELAALTDELIDAVAAVPKVLLSAPFPGQCLRLLTLPSDSKAKTQVPEGINSAKSAQPELS